MYHWRGAVSRNLGLSRAPAWSVCRSLTKKCVLTAQQLYVGMVHLDPPARRPSLRPSACPSGARCCLPCCLPCSVVMRTGMEQACQGRSGSAPHVGRQLLRRAVEVQSRSVRDVCRRGASRAPLFLHSRCALPCGDAEPARPASRRAVGRGAARRRRRHAVGPLSSGLGGEANGDQDGDGSCAFGHGRPHRPGHRGLRPLCAPSVPHTGGRERALCAARNRTLCLHTPRARSLHPLTAPASA